MAKPPDLRTSESTASSASADVPTRPPVMTRRAALAVGAGGLTAGLTTVGVGPAAALAGRADEPAQPRAAVATEGGACASGALAGQVALVTGAARGIGREIARACARAGADVVALDIADDIAGHPVPLATQADLAETQRLVAAEGRRVVSVRADVRDLPALRAAVADVLRAFGRIDVLAANAGINAPVPLLHARDDEFTRHWRNVLEVNVLGVANAMRAVLPHMIGRRRGRIVATTSTFGRHGNAANPNYVASKWAVIGLVKSAAIEAGPFGVAVNAIAPTAVRTGLGGPQTAEQRAAGDQWLRANYHALPVGILEPEDVADAAVFLASPGARYVTGQVLDVAAGANARYTA